MRLISPVGLAILLTIPVIVAIHIRRRRLPVRRVAGVFLWHDSAKSAQQANGVSGWDRQALIRDVLAVVGLAILACGLVAAEATDASDTAHWTILAGRMLVCVAVATLLLANWRRRLR